MEQFLEPIIGILGGALSGFIVAKWEMIKAKAAASDNKFDDAAVAIVEKIARSIAKEETANTLGGGQTQPPGGGKGDGGG